MYVEKEDEYILISDQGLMVSVKREEEGFVVDIFDTTSEHGDEVLGSTYAFFNECENPVTIQ